MFAEFDIIVLRIKFSKHLSSLQHGFIVHCSTAVYCRLLNV